jgi:hypothetical protein
MTNDKLLSAAAEKGNMEPSTVDPQVTTGLTCEQFGLRPKF